MSQQQVDFAIIGAGFYGCALALFLRSLTPNVVVIEAEDGLLTRASRVNQARIHGGFHYPRSFVTALRSQILQARFATDFKAAVCDDFDMIYAIARRRSKVSPDRFYRMFKELDAPIEVAGPALTGLFNPALIEGVFKCREFAFDWTRLRDQLAARLDRHRVPVRFATSVERIVPQSQGSVLELSDGTSLQARVVFNITYANINNLLLRSGLGTIGLKYEFSEIALVEAPREFDNLAVTVMDGPFFSLMPYPALGCYSLTHVRYTPHASWVDRAGMAAPDRAAGERGERSSRWRHMVADAQRYIRVLGDISYKQSLYEVKTVLLQNERDDGRPILFHRHGDAPGLISVMGAKIDNIYDLFTAVRGADPAWAKAGDGFLFGDEGRGLSGQP